MKISRKITLFVMLLTLVFSFIGCAKEKEETNPTENSEVETETAQTEMTETSERTETEIPDSQTQQTTTTPLEPIILGEDYGILYAEEAYIPSEITSGLERITATHPDIWYMDYNGEKLQRIAETQSNYCASCCPDTIFYRADEGETVEEVVKIMLEALIDPMTEDSETRAFTINEYSLGEQLLIEYENGYILSYVNAYYDYDGTDLIDMETALEENNKKEGDLVPFLRQGSDGVFSYMLMKEGDIYRLQRVGDMLAIIDTK